jgi:hypothetical protein
MNSVRNTPSADVDQGRGRIARESSSEVVAGVAGWRRNRVSAASDSGTAAPLLTNLSKPYRWLVGLFLKPLRPKQKRRA